MDLAGVHNFQIIRGKRGSCHAILSCTEDGKITLNDHCKDFESREVWHLAPVDGEENVYVITTKGTVKHGRVLTVEDPGGEPHVRLEPPVPASSPNGAYDRQKWHVEIENLCGAPQMSYIKYNGTAKGNKVYLNASQSGSDVDLAEGDNGVGLVRWQVQQPWNA